MKAPVPQWVLDGLPHPNARQVLSPAQRIIFAVLLALGIGALACKPGPVFLFVNSGVILLYVVFSVYKVILQFLSMRPPSMPVMPADYVPEHWPLYTILVPLYRERTAVPGLVAHLRRLEYPADRLQVLLLVEEDDDETIDACAACNLHAPFAVVRVPPSFPRTKPKACNFGLARTSGSYLVIYDAEDRPETDQLRKALYSFQNLPESFVCLQAKLNYYNSDRNLLTRLFAAEYSCWFDLCLPALFQIGAPIPLGGTSNHFKTAELLRLKGWDPFNVAEDCDLGIRIYMDGGQVACLDSTTWEEATERLVPWVRQRSRWVKGYLQTYLVHLRQPGTLLRQFGVGGTVHFHLLFGATAFCLLLNPIYWMLTLLWVAAQPSWLTALYPLWVLIPALTSLLLGNAAFVLAAMIACLNRRNYSTIPYCLLLPAYWVLMSIGAWRGALQLFTRPFLWEKTPHTGTMNLEGPREN